MIAGRRRRSGLDLGRHPRRRWVAWAIFGLVGAIVIGEVAADVVNSGPPAADVAARSYAAAVVPIIEESTALRLWLTDVRQNAPKLGRLGLETALGRLVAGARNLQYQAANLGIPAPSRRSARLLSDVLASRALAARLVTGGVALAIGPSRDVTGATAALVRAGGELAGSDADYASFLSSLPRRVRQWDAFPSSGWDAPSDWTSAALAGFAAMLSSSPGLLIHDSLVIVAISLHPDALRIVGLPAAAGPTTSTAATTSTTTTSTTVAGLTTGSTGSTTSSSTSTTSTSSTTTTTTTTLQIPPAGSISCLQPTNQVSVAVVVANAGDVGAVRVEVAATLAELSLPPAGADKHKKPTTSSSCGPGGTGAGGTSSSGGTASGNGNSSSSGASRTVRHVIALLPAGASDYVTMPALAVRGGSDYMLTVQFGSQRESVTLQVASG